MNIHDDHMYHGAALTQIADHPAFKAINAFRGINARGAFRINDRIGIFIKHATKPTKAFQEYVFTFNTKNQQELTELKTRCDKVFVVLVCIQARSICCITVEEFDKHVEARAADFGGSEPQYQLLVTAKPGRSFRVYMNAAGRKGKMLIRTIVSRNAFPKMIFE